MRYRLLLLLLAGIALLALHGCGSSGAPANPRGGESAPDALGEGIWPADALPSALPAYTGGKVAGSGGGAGEYTIVVRDTGREALGQYLEELKGAGWVVTGDDQSAQAVLEAYEIRLKWNDSASTVLQIGVYAKNTGEWPADQIPPDIPQPQTGALAEEVTVMETSDDMWYFNYTYEGVDEAAAKAYMEALIQNGWSGDTSMASREIQWKGAKYRASIEIYETQETRTTFTCNFYLEQ